MKVLSAQVLQEDDEAQRRLFALSIQRYAASLLVELGVKLDQKGPSSRKVRNEGEDEGENVDEEINDQQDEEQDEQDEEQDEEQDDEQDEGQDDEQDDEQDEGQDNEQDEGLDDQQKKKNNSKAAATAPKSRLDNLTLGLSTEVDLGALATIREDFFHELCNLKVRISKDNKMVTEQFAIEEALEITNFFFTEMMGGQAINRLSTLIQYYSGIDDMGLDRGAAARAAVLAQNSTTPLSLRVFFGSFSKMTETYSNDSSALYYIRQCIASFDLLDRFNKIKTIAHQRDRTLVTFLTDNGYTTKRGVSMQSCIINYLADSLDISVTNLKNSCQMALGVTGLIEEFGLGVITLLPRGTMNKSVSLFRTTPQAIADPS